VCDAPRAYLAVVFAPPAPAAGALAIAVIFFIRPDMVVVPNMLSFAVDAPTSDLPPPAVCRCCRSETLTVRGRAASADDDEEDDDDDEEDDDDDDDEDDAWASPLPRASSASASRASRCAAMAAAATRRGAAPASSAPATATASSHCRH
jgi:hypothetical protein